MKVQSFSWSAKVALMLCSFIISIGAANTVCAQTSPIQLVSPTSITNNNQNFVGGSSPTTNLNGSVVAYIDNLGHLFINLSPFPSPVQVLAPNSAAFIARNPSISQDGKRVVFESNDPQLGTAFNPPIVNNQVYLFDSGTSTITLISQVSSAFNGAVPDGNSFTPIISGDGNSVVFVSSAKNLTMTTGNGVANIFLRHINTSQTELVSTLDGKAPFTNSCAFPSIDMIGNIVAFSSGGQIFVRTGGNATTLPNKPPGGIAPAISGDGTTVAYISLDGSSIIVDGVTSTTTTMRAFGVDPDSQLSISQNGQTIAFSTVDALVSSDTNNLDDVYIITSSITDGNPKLLSLTDQGQLSNGNSSQPAISSDGNVVAFSSNATLTIDTMANVRPNVYAVNVNGTTVGGGTGGGQLTLVPVCPVAGKANDSSSISISWHNGEHAPSLRGYKVRVERYDPTKDEFVEIGLVPADTQTIFTDSGLQPRTVYDYRVWVIDTVGFAYNVDLSVRTKKVKPQ